MHLQTMMLTSYEREMLNNLIQRTLELRGTQFPNPSVGAMVIKDGTMISDGYHLVSGERHAEVVALDNAGDQACGATLLITLEPCCHDGKTPPCVDRIIASGVQRVVWAMNDPNPKMQGRAATVLVSHGLDVVAHALPAEAWPAIKEFHTFFDQKRPYIYVKAAMSLDGYIAPNANGLNYISSPESLTVVHRLRTYVQAICVGANTIAVDQPRLSVRLPNYVSAQPMIVILDPHNGVDMAWVQRAVSKGRRIALFQSHSHSHRPVPDGVWHDDGLTKNKTTNWQHVFSWLYRHGVQGVLIEGGCGVFQSILNAGYFDELWITKVPQFFSSDSSVPFLRGPLDSSLDITLDSVETHGADVVIKYKNNHAFKY